MKLYFSIYFETTFITCTLPNSKPIYTQYQNNIKGQGQRQISRSSDWIRLSYSICFGQEIAEYLMLFIPMYYCYLTIYQSWSVSLQVKKKLQSKEGGIKSCVNTLFQFFSMVILLQWNFGCIDFVFHMLNEWDDREKITTRVGALTSLSTSIKWWQMSNNPLSRYHPKEHIIICLHSKHLIRDAIQWHDIPLLNNIFYIYFSL